MKRLSKLDRLRQELSTAEAKSKALPNSPTRALEVQRALRLLAEEEVRMLKQHFHGTP